LKVLVGLCNTPPSFKRYVMECNVFLGYPTKGTSCVWSSFGHEQNPSNNVDQNKSTHGVYIVLQ